MRPTTGAALVLLLGMTPRLAAAQVVEVRPVDEAQREPSLVRFRAAVLQAVAQRDTARVLAAFAPDVRLSFGDTEGIPELRRRLQDEHMWAELTDILEHGGRFQGDSLFAAPYWFAAAIDADPFAILVVIGSNVRVRQRPGLGAPTIATLSHQAVLSSPQRAEAAQGWERVQLADGRQGFVSTQYVRSPVGYRVGFQRQGSGWRIIFFLAGD